MNNLSVFLSLPVVPQFSRATRKDALTCLLRLSPLLCCRASCASTVLPRHSQRRTCVLTAAAAASFYRRFFARIQALTPPMQGRAAPYASIKPPVLHGRVNCYSYYILFLLIRKPLAFLWVSMVIYAVVRNELKYLVLL